MEKEMVNHPEHYNQGNIECIDAMVSAFGVEAVKDFCIINAFKYVWRMKDKNGTQDVNKAIWYLNKFKELSAGTVNETVNKETVIGELAKVLQNNSTTSVADKKEDEIETTHWVDDKDAPKPSLEELDKKEVVDYSKTFNCGFSGTSKLVRMPSKGIIKIARRKADRTGINEVCIPDAVREKFFADVNNLRNSSFFIQLGQPYYREWNDYMNKEFERQYKFNKIK